MVMKTKLEELSRSIRSGPAKSIVPGMGDRSIIAVGAHSKANLRAIPLALTYIYSIISLVWCRSLRRAILLDPPHRRLSAKENGFCLSFAIIDNMVAAW
jgi:hypothetical protein